MVRLVKEPNRLPRSDHGELALLVLIAREMVLLVHGFPDNKTALYFEWSWQNPHEAKLLRDEVKKLQNMGKRTLLKAKIR
jgi:hypothetical protein